MAVQRLDAHYERSVEVDLCGACRLAWFDADESPRLSGLGWAQLLQRLQHDTSAAHAWAGRPLGCARCRKPLQAVVDQTRYGRFVLQRCNAGHGTLQSHASLLGQRGLVREPTAVERAAIGAERRQWSCLNCGAAIAGTSRHCSYCRSPVLMYDLPRLAASLLPRAMDRDVVSAARLSAWACHACGEPLDPTRQPACTRCGHPVLALSAGDLRPVLQALQDQWQAWLAQPRHSNPALGKRTRWFRDRPARPLESEPSVAPIDWVPWIWWLGFGLILAAGWALVLPW